MIQISITLRIRGASGRFDSALCALELLICIAERVLREQHAIIVYAVTFSEAGLFESLEEARNECINTSALEARIVKVADSLQYDPWLVRTESGDEYWALGYERRGAWNVPIADCKDGQCISCEVYKIIHEFYDDDVYMGIKRPNQVELELLDHAGWEYDGAFAHKKGE